MGVAGAGAGDDGSGDGTGEGSGEGGGYEGPVWMLRQGTLKAYWEEDYTALECTRDGGLSCKPANSTSGAVGRWVGCGVQLSLGSEGVGAGGVNCTSVSLEVVES